MSKNSTQRLTEIVKVLAYYGFGYVVDSKLGKDNKSPANLRKACEELGSTFIKIGQILSTRPDLLHQSYIDELSKLQNNVPPEKFEDIDEVFYGEFKVSAKEFFLEFDENPLASASVAQVHRARLKSGNEVIVKIQRPHIYEKMKMDISILSKLINLTRVKLTDALIDPAEALQEILNATEAELDFTIEASNIEKFSEYNREVAFVYTPLIVKELCSKKVLVMERIHGFKIDDIDKLRDEGYDTYDIGKKLALAIFKQVFEDGYFHADPHPGNLLIKENKICFLDFGLMGTLSTALKCALNDLVFAVAYHDVNKIISILMAIGIKKGYINRNKLYEDIDYIIASYMSTSLENIKISAMLQDIFQMANGNNIRLPKELTLLMRSMLIIEGVVAKISPEIKIIDIAIPYVKATNKTKFLKDLNWNEVLLQVYGFVRDSSQLPRKVMEMSDSIIKGRAKVQLEHKNLENSISEINKMINRLSFALLDASLIIGSSLVLSSNSGPKIYNVSIIGLLGFGVSAFLSLWLMISILKSGRM